MLRFGVARKSRRARDVRRRVSCVTTDFLNAWGNVDLDLRPTIISGDKHFQAPQSVPGLAVLTPQYGIRVSLLDRRWIVWMAKTTSRRPSRIHSWWTTIRICLSWVWI